MKTTSTIASLFLAAQSALALNLTLHRGPGHTCQESDITGSLGSINETEACIPLSYIQLYESEDTQSISGYFPDPHAQNLTFYSDAACGSVYFSTSADFCIDSTPVSSFTVTRIGQ